MSDFTVLRSLDGYCLVLDKKRIAGGKPDYRGENVLVDWTTEVAYGPVDDLAAENAKLREEVRYLKKGDVLHVLTDQEFAEQQKHEREMQASIKALDDENKKLRELVRDYENCTMHADCAGCEYDGKLSTHCPLSPCFPDIDELCELGVMCE